MQRKTSHNKRSEDGGQKLLTMALGRSEWSASWPGHLTPMETAHSTPQKGMPGKVSQLASTFLKREFTCGVGNELRITGCLACTLVAMPIDICCLSTLVHKTINR
jgi:hypothetical protein